jgi:hypothetical protein
MPTVGKGKTAKKFPYTAAGKTAAKKHAKTTGKRIVKGKKAEA